MHGQQWICGLSILRENKLRRTRLAPDLRIPRRSLISPHAWRGRKCTALRGYRAAAPLPCGGRYGNEPVSPLIMQLEKYTLSFTQWAIWEMDNVTKSDGRCPAKRENIMKHMQINFIQDEHFRHRFVSRNPGNVLNSWVRAKEFTPVTPRFKQTPAHQQ